jgi:hypothetical protein
MALYDVDGAFALSLQNGFHQATVLGIVGGYALWCENLVLCGDPMSVAADAIDLSVHPHD